MNRAALMLALLVVGCNDRPLALEGNAPGADEGTRADLGSARPNPPDAGDAGSGLFVSTLTILPLPTGYEPRSVVIADVTGDGRNDVVVGATSTSSNYDVSVIVFAQLPAGVLAAPVVYPTGAAGYQVPNMLAVADFDGDGRQDAALTGYYDFRVLLQTTTGGLGAPRTLTGTRPFDECELLAAGDFDGDGRSDLVAAAYNASGVDVWYQAEAFGAPHHFDCAHGGGDSIPVADLDGDGALDIALSSYLGSTVCMLLQRAGGFAPATTLPLTEKPPPEAVAATDVDGDGRTDLLLVSSHLSGLGKYLDVLHQKSDGTFAAPDSLDTAWYPNGLLLADVDADGRLDVLVPHFEELVVGVYRRLPAGGLAPEETYAYAKSELNSAGPQRTAAGDLNGDGKPDIATVATNLTILYHR